MGPTQMMYAVVSMGYGGLFFKFNRILLHQKFPQDVDTVPKKKGELTSK